MLLKQFNSKVLAVLILLHLAFRIVLCFILDLGVDEAYYTSYVADLDWSYYDHPPLVGWLLALTTFKLQLYDEFFVRLSPLILGTFNIILCYKVGNLLGGKNCGLCSSLLYLSSFYTTIVTGTFILPDTPLVTFWLLALYMGIKYHNENQVKYLYWFALFVGIALLAKYQACFLWFGMFLHFLLFNQKRIVSRSMIVASIITILLFLPVILWNIFSTNTGLDYHIGRINQAEESIFWMHGIQLISAEILYQNPLIFIILLLCCIFVFIMQWHRQKTIAFLLLSSLPLIIVVWTMHFFSKSTLPHWSGPAYIGLILVSAYTIVRLANSLQFQVYLIWVKRLAFGSVGLCFTVLTSLVLFFGIFQPTQLFADDYVEGDQSITLDMTAWTDISETLAQFQDTISTPFALLVDGWIVASRVDYYVALPLAIDLLVMGDSHQYKQHNQHNIKLIPNDVYFFRVSHYKQEIPSILEQHAKIFDIIKLPVTAGNHKELYIYLQKIQINNLSFL